MGAACVVGIDHHEYRLEAAEKLGSIAVDFERDDVVGRVNELSGGRGADVVVEAVGTAAALGQAVSLVRPWGRLVGLGVGIEPKAEFPIGDLTSRHVQFISAGIPPVKNYMAPLSRMLVNGVLDPAPIASHLLPLDDAAKAYELIATRSDGALKILLRP
jgi:threonine dehydrogenase-like Zn-dependent dehydrogenase